MEYTTIKLSLGAKEYDVEVAFNYTPPTQPEGRFPGMKEEFEICSLLNVDTEGYIFCESDSGELIEILGNEIIAKIKQQREKVNERSQ